MESFLWHVLLSSLVDEIMNILYKQGNLVQKVGSEAESRSRVGKIQVQRGERFPGDRTCSGRRKRSRYFDRSFLTNEIISVSM